MRALAAILLAVFLGAIDGAIALLSDIGSKILGYLTTAEWASAGTDIGNKIKNAINTVTGWADQIDSMAEKAKNLVEYVAKVLLERDIVIASKPLEATEMLVDGVRWTYVFYENGLAINVLYALEPGGKRAVGFKLSMGMDVPEELASKFKFARQKSKLAGEIRGSFFVVKGEY